MIINIPSKTIINRIIPKDRFKFKDATKVRRILWIAKLAPNTINLPSKKILEIEVFSIEMLNFDEKVIMEILDKIKKNILFIINDDIAVMQYNSQLFIKRIENPLEIKGLTIDDVSDNFIRQLLDINDIAQPLIKQVALINKIQFLQKSIDKKNREIKKTIQLNKRQMLAHERYALQQQLIKLKENNYD